MTRRVLVAGTGKMARNIGRWLAQREVGVTFASRSAERLHNLEQWARKRMRRAFQNADQALVPTMLRIDSADSPASTRTADGALEHVDVVIEATRENREAKASLLAALTRPLAGDVLLTSTSSSILPSEIHGSCLGLHFFYPVELTGCVELVIPETAPPGHESRARALCAELGLHCIAQTEANAFMANRLLLPLQTECARALLAGHPPEVVDAASVSDLLPVGQLALMDSVGLDVMAQSVRHYAGRMSAPQADSLHPLEMMLQALIDDDRLGARCQRGLLVGGPLPWTPTGGSPPPEAELCRALFVNECLRAVDSGEIDRNSLEAIVDGIYGGSEPFARFLRIEAHSMLRLLEELFLRTGAWYCSPAPSLRALGP